MFILQSEYDSAGDQEQAIDILVKQIEDGQERCVLLAVSYTHLTLPTNREV